MCGNGTNRCGSSSRGLGAASGGYRASVSQKVPLCGPGGDSFAGEIGDNFAGLHSKKVIDGGSADPVGPMETSSGLSLVGDAPALYTISVAAELDGTSAQNLRAYERAGLVTPHRTAGGTRRHTVADIQRYVESPVCWARG